MITSGDNLQKQSHEDRLRGSVSAIQLMDSHIHHCTSLISFWWSSSPSLPGLSSSPLLITPFPFSLVKEPEYDKIGE
jgi:hypothetical protein